MGVELFERTSHGLVPTAALSEALPQLSAGFTALADGLTTLRGPDERTLVVTVASVFASRLLIWRIGKFSALHPEIEVRMVVTGRLIDLARSDIDCAIRFGTGDWPTTVTSLLGGKRYRPVCTPSIARQLKRPADLVRVPQIRDETAMLRWDDWFAAAGMVPVPLTGPTYTDATIAFDAAISGQGVLLAVDLMSADAVSDGRLVRPFDAVVDSDMGYWFATAKGRRETRKVRVFRDWLISEVSDSADGYVPQLARKRKP
ncbi:MAG: LysR family transcriptional regulator [Devosia sp.]|nr:LysR family transcriptional regulator [Devosia sp.]